MGQDTVYTHQTLDRVPWTVKKRPIIFCNKHFLYFIYMSLLIDMKLYWTSGRLVFLLSLHFISHHPLINPTHSCSLIIACHYLGSVNWYQLSIQWHTFTVSLLSCSCIFKYDCLPAFGLFVLLFCTPFTSTSSPSLTRFINFIVSSAHLSQMSHSCSPPTSVLIPWEYLLAAAHASITKSHCRVLAPKTSWQEMITYHLL